MDPIVRGDQPAITLDFTGYFTYQYDGVYGNYCGDLEYELDLTGPAQTYLTYDGGYLLTLAPLASHADG